MDSQQIENINYEEAYTELKNDYESLVEKHNSLEKDYENYKIHSSIKSDIRTHRLELDDNDINLLKNMRKDNIEAYNILLENFKLTKQSKEPYIAWSTSNTKKEQSSSAVTFGSAIKNILGGNN